jgi:5-methylcytosine-specific restriction endonuclease McrA
VNVPAGFAKHQPRYQPAPRPSAAARGYDSKWQRESKAFLAKPENRKCFYCLAPATCVDHAIPHKGNKKLFWDRSNWRPSCGPCNSRKNAKTEGGFGNPMK